MPGEELRGGNRKAPWRTIEDNWVLKHLDGDAYRSFEALIHQQARSDLRYTTNAPIRLDATPERREH